MKRTLAFFKRNSLEMLRDPVMYIFCIGFPVVLLLLFTMINAFTPASMSVFEPLSIVPGVMVFSFTFVMLTGSLLVSKDRSTAFLVRLYSSPMRTVDFVLGYFIPLFIIGVAQAVICIVTGAIISAAFGATYFSFGAAMLLILAELPALVTFAMLGILFGTAMSEKSAPAITSVFISAAGVLGGAWMPLDTMGGFETFCKFLPFYPSVYLGRAVTGAQLTLGGTYTIGAGEWWVFVAVFGYLAVCTFLSLFIFNKKSKI